MWAPERLFGRWVDRHVLEPLGVARGEAWITDCLDNYFESSDAAARLEEPELGALLTRLGIAARHHHPHPSEATIVSLALSEHASRLVEEIRTATPDCLVTLGNAALRVVSKLAQRSPDGPRRLSPDPVSYGRPVSLRIADRDVEWYPLAHPAAPAVYQRAHASWVRAMDAQRGRGGDD